MQEPEKKLTMGEKLGTIAPPVLLMGMIAFWAIPSAIGMIGGPKPTQLKMDDKIVYAIGHAEGTRTCDGGRTEAYMNHTDPGDGRSNSGTFSAAPRGNGITTTMTPEDRDTAFLDVSTDFSAVLI